MKDDPDYGNIVPKPKKDSEEEFYEDSVEDWELLGLDPDTSQEEIDKTWDDQF